MPCADCAPSQVVMKASEDKLNRCHRKSVSTCGPGIDTEGNVEERTTTTVTAFWLQLPRKLQSFTAMV